MEIFRKGYKLQTELLVEVYLTFNFVCVWFLKHKQRNTSTFLPKDCRSKMAFTRSVKFRDYLSNQSAFPEKLQWKPQKPKSDYLNFL